MLGILALLIILNALVFPLLLLAEQSYSFAMNSMNPHWATKWVSFKFQALLEGFNQERLLDVPGDCWLTLDLLGGLITIITMMFIGYWIIVPLVFLVALVVCRKYTSNCNEVG